MIDAGQLILNMARDGHPLATSIEENETTQLISNIRERLNATEDVLNLSPISLEGLSALLLDYYQTSIWNGKEFTEEEIATLIREIAAYVGIVFIKHSRGKWRTTGSLWGTEIFFEGPVYSVKEGTVRTAKSGVVSLGQLASSTWTALQYGVEPKLYKGFKLLTAKIVKEKL
jgi:hypothetical protein